MGQGLGWRALIQKSLLVFIEAKKAQKAMIAFEKALEWQELFDLAAMESVLEEDIVAMGYRVAGTLHLIVSIFGLKSFD